MKFTALMPVHNQVKFKFLRKSLDSVMLSTLLPNEFLILIDGPISKKKKLFLKNFCKNNNIIKLVFKKKLGLTKILNYGLKIAKYEIVARVDSDDVNDPSRFYKQIKFLRKNKVDIVGTGIFEINKNKKFKKNMIAEPSLLNYLFFNPLNHMSIMYKKSKILKLGGYPDIKYKEDYALWLLAKLSKYKIFNLNETLVSCHIDNQTFSRLKSISSIISEFLILKLIIKKNYLFFPISLISFLLRITFLLLPKPIYRSSKRILNK